VARFLALPLATRTCRRRRQRSSDRARRRRARQAWLTRTALPVADPASADIARCHGRLNKLIAAELGLAEVTVTAHRSQIMHKMGAKSLPELVRMADRLSGAPEKD
jgi:FixJ family two-component response regulator